MNHPILPCGFNADDNNGDEVDGAGTNWPIWPVLFDTFVGLTPLIVSEEMLEAFDNECADYTLAYDLWEMSIPWQDNLLSFNEKWGTQLIPEQNNTLTLPYQRREIPIRTDWPDQSAPGTSGTLLLSREPRGQVVRKKQ